MDHRGHRAVADTRSMTIWETAFLVEPFPDTPWDRRDLELWRLAAESNAYAAVDRRRSVQVSTEIEAEDEGSAVAAGRERVDAHFPPSRYTVQNPRYSPPANAQRLLRDGAAQFLTKNYAR